MYFEADMSLLASCDNCWMNASEQLVTETNFKEDEPFVKQEHNEVLDLKKRYYFDNNGELLKIQEEYPVSDFNRGYVFTRFLKWMKEIYS